MKKNRLYFCALLAAALFLSGCAMGGAKGENTIAGNEALEDGEYLSAADYFQAAINLGEQPVLAYRGLGMAYMGMADYEKANEAFGSALENTDKKMPKLKLDLKKYMASAEYHQDAYDRVIEICSDILSEEEGMQSDVYFLRGASYLKKGEENEAKSDFDAAAALTPDDYTLYLNIYECYNNQNLSGLGTEYLHAALNLHGNETEDAYHRGRIYYYLGDYTKALDELLDPVEEKYEPAMIQMAEVYLAKNEFARAKNLYTQVEDLYGESAQLDNGLAMCCMKEGTYDEALAYISKGLALADGTEYQDLYFNEMVAYEKKLDFATAKEKARAYTERYPTDERGQKELMFLNTRS